MSFSSVGLAVRDGGSSSGLMRIRRHPVSLGLLLDLLQLLWWNSAHSCGLFLALDPIPALGPKLLLKPPNDVGLQ